MNKKMFRTILASLFLSTLGFVLSSAAQAQQLPQNAAYSLCQLDPAHPTGIRCAAFGGGSCVASPAGFPDDWRCSPPGHPGFAECRAGPFFSVRTQSAELSCDYFDGPGFCFEPRSELPGTLVCHAVVVTPAIGVSPSSIAFPDQEIGTGSALQTVTITSVGNGPLAIFSLTASGDFQVASSNCPGSLSVGSFCQVGLRFVPTEVGSRTGQLAIHHNAPGSVATVPLSGIGLAGSPAVVLSPSTLSFGSRYYGTLSAPSVVNLTNSGSGPLVIGGIDLSGLDYSLVSNTCPGALSAGASSNLQVTFRPYAVGARVGEIRVVTDAAGSPHFVGLSGTGGGATFSSMNAGFLTSLDLIAMRIKANFLVEHAEKSGGDDDIRRCNPDHGPCPPVVVEAPHARCGIQFPELCFNNSPGRVCLGNCTPDPATTLANWIAWTSRLNERVAPDDEGECEADLGGEGPSFAPPDDIGKNAPADSSNEAGDPINLGAANKFHEQVDYAGSDSQPLVFVRTYNSQPFESTAFVRQSFGPAWTSNLDRSVTVLPDGASAIVTRGDGKSLRYARQPGGSWAGDPGVVATLQMLSDASGAPTGWKYTGGSGDVETFDALGRWTTFTLRDGNAFALSYDASGRLQQITSPSGRRLTFEYDARGRVTRMVDPAGAGTSYTYDTLNRLTGVTYADGRSRGYRYEHPTFAFSLTGIVDGMGRLYASFAYDEANRPVSSQFAGGVGATTIAYNADGTVSVTDPDGTVWTRTFVVNQGIAQATSIRANCADCAGHTRTFRYDALGRLVSMRDARLIERNYRYDSRGLLASVVEASGTPEQRETTFTWDAARKLMTGSSRQERSTLSTLDGLGRPTNETSSGGGLSRTTTYS